MRGKRVLVPDPWHDPICNPTKSQTRWGLVPIYGSKRSFKYLGYFINISSDFSTQHKEMAMQALEQGLR